MSYYKIQFMKYLYLSSHFLALVPYYNFGGERQYEMTKLYKGYLIFKSLLAPSLGIVCSIEILNNTLASFSKTQWVLSCLNVSLIILYNTMTYIDCYRKREEWKKLLGGLSKLDVEMNFTQSFNIYSTLELVIGISIGISLTVYENYYLFESTYSNKVLLYRLMYMPAILSYYLVGNLAFTLQNRMEHVNKNLASSSPSNYIKLVSIYRRLNKLIEIYKSIFEVRIFLSITFAMSHVLSCINFLLEYSKSPSNIVAEDVVVSMACQTVIWTMSYLCVFYKCHGANLEFTKTSGIASSLVYFIDDNPKYAKLVKWLAVDSHQNYGQITAANVFTVDVSAFFSSVGSLFSMVIILMQLKI